MASCQTAWASWEDYPKGTCTRGRRHVVYDRFDFCLLWLLPPPTLFELIGEPLSDSLFYFFIRCIRKRVLRGHWNMLKYIVAPAFDKWWNNYQSFFTQLPYYLLMLCENKIHKIRKLKVLLCRIALTSDRLQDEDKSSEFHLVICPNPVYILCKRWSYHFRRHSDNCFAKC